ncbi:hypothetical protein [Nocardioides montaniterrae]
MTDYRIAKPVLFRIVGSYVVLLALVTLVLTVVIGTTDVSFDVLVVVLGVGVLVVLGVAWWVRRQIVVRLSPTGYRVNLVRGAGVTEARWTDVEDVVAASQQKMDCVVVRLTDGRTTTIPMQMLAADKDDFAHDVRRHLDAARS